MVDTVTVDKPIGFIGAGQVGSQAGRNDSRTAGHTLLRPLMHACSCKR